MEAILRADVWSTKPKLEGSSLGRLHSLLQTLPRFGAAVVARMVLLERRTAGLPSMISFTYPRMCSDSRGNARPNKIHVERITVNVI